MSLIVASKPWRPLQTRRKFAPRGFTPDYVWSSTQGGFLYPSNIAPTSYSGANTYVGGSLALAHNGSSQYENWRLPADVTSAFPVVIAASFIVTETATTVQTAYSLGGSVVSSGLYSGVGQYAAGTIGGWIRVAIAAGDVNINGPTAVIGRQYNVARISRSQTSHVLYVNGERYTSATDSNTPNGAWRNFSIGTCVRDTTPVFYGKQSVLQAWHAFRDPGDEWLCEWSLNPFDLLFESQRIWVPSAAAGGLPTLSNSTYVTGSLSSTGWRPQITAS